MYDEKLSKEKKQHICEVLQTVYDALEYKGYNAVSQISRYIMTEDPTYITFYNNARSHITELDREEILECLLEMHFNK